MKLIKKLLKGLRELFLILAAILFVLIYDIFDYLFLPLWWLFCCFIIAYNLPTEFSINQIWSIIASTVGSVLAIHAGKVTYYHFYKKYLRYKRRHEND